MKTKMSANGVNHASPMEMSDRKTIVEEPIKRRKNHDEQFDYAEIQKMLPEQFDDLYKTLPLTDDTTCGLGIFKGGWLQK